mgnify:CR=1 FL=1
MHLSRLPFSGRAGPADALLVLGKEVGGALVLGALFLRHQVGRQPLPADRIVHRGQDEDGFDVDGHAGIGMRRLSVIDLGRDAIIEKAEEKEHASNEKLDRLFRKIIPKLLDSKFAGYGFLLGLIGLFFAVMAMFYTTAVTVKMLPYDNKGEFAVVIDMPEGTALPATSNMARTLAEKLREIPEVTAMQTYAGTARPFDFNGMVRHYYLRAAPELGELQINLAPRSERKRSAAWRRRRRFPFASSWQRSMTSPSQR